MHKDILGLRLCICTPDYVHLVKNGGIGTSFYHTALTLIENGAEVTIIYTPSINRLNTAERAQAERQIAREGAKLVFLRPDPLSDGSEQIYPGDEHTVTSYLTYKKLKDEDFDIVLFPDWRGIAYFSVHAKRQGLAFAKTQLWIQGHSSSLWHELNNNASSFTELNMRIFHYERKSIELCDRFISATHYLFAWKKEHGFRFPPDAHVLPLIIRNELLAQNDSNGISDTSSGNSITELVFFGRLERRKGLQIFLQALQRIWNFTPDLLSPSRVHISFLGKVERVEGMSAVEYIERYLKKIPIRYTINASLSSHEAVGFLKSRKALAVIPSLTDNSPMTVHECMNAQIPFIASNAGGIPEIVHPDDHEHALFTPMVPDLAAAISRALEHGQLPARPALDQQKTNIPRWISLLSGAMQEAQAAAPKSLDEPLVSVSVTHYERPGLLRKTMQGLVEQTYKNFEVILVDNGSRTPEAVRLLENVGEEFPALRIRVERLPDLFPGAARNHALRLAQGQYFLVMDDDNYAHPKQIETFVRAALSSGFDALSCAAAVFQEDQDPANLQKFDYIYLPAGSGISLNLFSNLYGDANSFFKTASIRAIGGYSEERSSWEDYEILSALELEGYKVAVVPELLLYLRMTSSGVSRNGPVLGNYYRALRPAFKHFPWDTYGDALLVALNSSLQTYSRVNFDTSIEAADSQIINNSENPIVVSRLLARRTFANGRGKEGIEQLMRLAASSPALKPLYLDAVLSTLALQGPHALTIYENGGNVHELAKALRTSIASKNLSMLAETLERASGERPLLPDESYMLGLALLAFGHPVRGLLHWADMLLDADRMYKAQNPDIERAVALKAFPHGVSHYLRHGHGEARAFSYTVPAHQAFARTTLMVPGDYFTYIDRFDQLSALEAADLLLKIVAAGSTFGAFEFATASLKQAGLHRGEDPVPQTSGKPAARILQFVSRGLKRMKSSRSHAALVIEQLDSSRILNKIFENLEAARRGDQARLS